MMSTGTDVIQDALAAIGAHSTVAPASPKSLDLGLRTLNGMLEMWLSRGIFIGFTPMSVVGDELNEPNDVRQAIVYNLAIELSPSFDNGRQIVSPGLRSLARNQFTHVKSLYKKLVIPKKVVSSMLPVGAGRRHDRRDHTFFGETAELDN